MARGKEAAEVRLLYQDPQGQVIPPLFTSHSAIMSANETDITKQLIMPFINSPVFKKDDKLVIWLKTVAADVVEVNPDDVDLTAKVQIPVTIRNIRTGVISRTYLNGADFTDLSTSPSFAAGVGKEWCQHTILAGNEMKLGHKYAFNSRVMISPYDDS